MLGKFRDWLWGDSSQRLSRLEAEVLELKSRVAPLSEAAFVEFERRTNAALDEIQSRLDRPRTNNTRVAWASLRNKAEAGERFIREHQNAR